MRLIDADALKDDLCKFCKAMDSHMADCNDDCMTHSIIDEQPTIEAEPVKCGVWLTHGDTAICSVCGQWCNQRALTYCANCGAKTRGSEQNA